MASKDFIGGQFCVARVNTQSSLQCFQEREDLGSRELEARVLATEDMGRLTSLGPGCVVIVAIGGFLWRPKALEQQHLRLGKTAVLRDMRLGDYFTPSNEIAACGVCP